VSGDSPIAQAGGGLRSPRSHCVPACTARWWPSSVSAARHCAARMWEWGSMHARGI